MSERKHRENLQHQAEHTRPRRRMSVLGYLLVLFAVAFLLLLLAYFQQQRANAEATDALKQSVSAVDTIEKMIAENEQLREQVEQLEAETKTLGQENQNLKTLTENLTARLEKTQAAMDYFWQVDEAYVRGRYGLCRDLIQEMEDVTQGTALKDYLPTESATDTDRFSPAQRYQEIYDSLY